VEESAGKKGKSEGEDIGGGGDDDNSTGE
jgi:hypothetical protein